MDMGSISILILDGIIMMKKVVENIIFQYLFDDDSDHIMEILNHSEGVLQYRLKSTDRIV